MLTVEVYEPQKHGHVDDCDWVISWDHDHWEGDLIAKNLADQLSCNWFEGNYNNTDYIYSCHA